MSEPNLVFGNTAIDLRHAPIRREWVIDGDPVARNQVIGQSADRMAMTLIWDCTAGSFRWIYDTDETIHILEGAVTLTSYDGSVKHLQAGDVVFFPAGSTATWQVHGYVRKIAFFRQPMPTPLSLFLRAFKKAAGLVGGAAAGAAGTGMAQAPKAAPAASPARLPAAASPPRVSAVKALEQAYAA